MSIASLSRLIALAAIWGASFLFIRMSAPVLGAALMAELRVLLAALFLLLVGAVLGKRLAWRAHWRHYLVLGLLNSALPFLLFGLAAQTLSASLLSILNATAPIWGALIGAIWLKAPLSPKAALGLGLGVAGVAVLVGMDASALGPGGGPAIAMALAAACSYGAATHYARTAKSLEPFANAHGSMWAATLLLAPALPFLSNPVVPSAPVALAVLALGVVCSGVAYLLYFRLIADIGAAPTLTVTFLIPLFGLLWGHLVLDEAIGWRTGAGAAIVIGGTVLVTGFSPRSLFARRDAAARAGP